MSQPKYRLLERSPNYVKIQIDGEPEIIHLIRSGHYDGQNTEWFRFHEDAYETEPSQSGIDKLFDKQVIEQYGIDPNS